MPFESETFHTSDIFILLFSRSIVMFIYIYIIPIYWDPKIIGTFISDMILILLNLLLIINCSNKIK